MVLALLRLLTMLVPLAVLLAIAAVLPAPRAGTAVQVGPIRRVVPQPYVFEPDIAVDPTNPNHLAATVASADDLDCHSLDGGCSPTLLLATSQDGGATWGSQRLTPTASIDGVVAFAPDGALYEAGLEFVPGSTAFVHRGLPENAAGVTSEHQFPGVGADKPWLAIDPTSGVLELAYVGEGLQSLGALHWLLARSTDGGKTWMEEEAPVDGLNQQPLLGRGGQLAVAMLRSMGRAATLQGVETVAVATSPDGGKTFAKPTALGEGWGLEGTAWGGGAYYVAYAGTPVQGGKLMIAASRNGGKTWSTNAASGAVSLYYSPVAPAPALAVAPDGTLDLLFYAATGACATAAAYFASPSLGEFGPRWLDHCTYDVYYTFSKDSGQTWAAPYRLNPQPIDGTKFVQIPSGRSRPGEYVGLAATDRFADALWIATNAIGTEADFARIAR